MLQIMKEAYYINI